VRDKEDNKNDDNEDNNDHSDNDTGDGTRGKTIVLLLLSRVRAKSTPVSLLADTTLSLRSSVVRIAISKEVMLGAVEAQLINIAVTVHAKLAELMSILGIDRAELSNRAGGIARVNLTIKRSSTNTVEIKGITLLASNTVADTVAAVAVLVEASRALHSSGNSHNSEENKNLRVHT